MKKYYMKIIIITLSITVAAVVKRVAVKSNKKSTGYWSDGPTLHVTIH